MKTLTTTLAFALALAFSLDAGAHTSCAGQTYGGSIVEIHVNTNVPRGFPVLVRVDIFDEDGSIRGYDVKRDDITQFFETDDGSRAFVGLSAFQAQRNPLWIRYVGTNHQDSLVNILRDPNRKPEAGNEMHVWKGPGYAAGEQYSFKDVVCTVALDP